MQITFYSLVNWSVYSILVLVYYLKFSLFMSTSRGKITIKYFLEIVSILFNTFWKPAG